LANRAVFAVPLVIFVLAVLVMGAYGSSLLPGQEQQTTTQMITETVTTSTTCLTSIAYWFTFTIVTSTGTVMENTTQTWTHMTTEIQTTTSTTTAMWTATETVAETTTTTRIETRTILALGRNLTDTLEGLILIIGLFMGGAAGCATWQDFARELKTLLTAWALVSAALLPVAVAAYASDGFVLGIILIVTMSFGALLAFEAVAILISWIKSRSQQ
jgi:hypothetical protein